MAEPKTENPIIAAFLREREGYARREMADRVAQVDEQLAHHGYQPSSDSSNTSEAGTGPEPGSTPPKGRRTARKSTT